MLSRKPQITYGWPPAASSRPAWILWVIVCIVSTLPLLASVVPGLWHITQYCTSTRPPPCRASRSWHPLHELTSAITRVWLGFVTCTERPLASKVTSKYGLTRTVSPAALT